MVVERATANPAVTVINGDEIAIVECSYEEDADSYNAVIPPVLPIVPGCMRVVVTKSAESRDGRVDIWWFE